MKIRQEFTVTQPLPAVWKFFHDIPSVARCLPGAEYLGTGEGGKHSGKVSAKVGPFQASFEGEADVRYDEASKTIAFEGKGVDRKGASRGKMTMDCVLAELPGATRITVAADVQLSGTIAQFGRTGLITEIANVLVADFVRNAEQELAARASPPDGASGPSEALPAAAMPIGGITLLLMSLKAWLRSLFRQNR